MKWMRFRVRTNTASEDIVISAMEDVGLYGAEIQDKVPLSGRELEELFIDEAPVPAIADDNGEADLACLNFYVEVAEEKDGALLLRGGDDALVTPEEIQSGMLEAIGELKQFSDIGDGTVTVSVTEDIDWRDNWKQYFHRFFIDDVLVLPSWEEANGDGTDTAQAGNDVGRDMGRARYILRIDPGAAFGTGLHETTRLAVKALEAEIKKRSEGSGTAPSVLDIGTGSGVLSILSLMFGAGYALGVDLDPLAVAAAEENRDRNGYGEDSMTALKGDVIGDADFRARILEIKKQRAGEGGYDTVAANILPNVLIPLAPVIPELLAPGGTLIYSGILLTKADEVTAALTAAGFKVTEKTDLGEWCSLRAERA